MYYIIYIYIYQRHVFKETGIAYLCSNLTLLAKLSGVLSRLLLYKNSGLRGRVPCNDAYCALCNIQLSSYQMPSLSELKGRQYFISVTSHNERMQYLSRRRIYFNGNSYGFILVKTDKPIYKPEQTGKVCVCGGGVGVDGCVGE